MNPGGGGKEVYLEKDTKENRKKGRRGNDPGASFTDIEGRGTQITANLQ